LSAVVGQLTVKHYFFAVSQFHDFYVENYLHFNLADFPVAYQITTITLMVMGSSNNLHVVSFAILLKLRKFYAREVYMFYSNQYKLWLLVDEVTKHTSAKTVTS